MPVQTEFLIAGAYQNLTRDTWFGRSRRRQKTIGTKAKLLRLGRWLLLAILWFHLLFFGTVFWLTLCYKISNPALTSLMVHRALAGTKIKPVQFIRLNQIGLDTRNIFIELEDHDFYSHFGVSPSAIKEAMRINRLRGKTIAGGSTITQQLARNLFLSPKKTYVRKYLEAGCALILEAVLGKRRIMELYLNYIEFGPGVFGLGQASHFQYKTSYANLSYEERVRMAVIITSPLRWNVHNFNNNRGMLARYYAIMGGSPDEE